MTISLVSDITLKSSQVVCDWQTQYKIQYSLANSHIHARWSILTFPGQMSLARDTGHRGSILGRSRPFQDGWQAYLV